MPEFLQNFLNAIPAVVKALLLLILAFIVAAIVRALVTKLIERTKLNDVFTKADGDKPGQTKTFVGRLVYLIVFLLFIPGIFSSLGVDSIAAPILAMLSKIWSYIPNILGAVIILIVGFLIARLVRTLLIPVFNKIRLDKLQEKAGIEVSDQQSKLSNTLAYIVYVLILIPVIIMALQVLQISAISDPAIGMLDIIFKFIPNIFVACLIIYIGVVIGRFGSQIVARLIGATGIDKKIQRFTDGKMTNFIFSKLIGTIVYVLIVIFFTVEGISILRLGVLTQIGTAIIGYIPSVVAAAIILIAALLVSSFVDKGLRKLGYNGYAAIARVAIMVLAVFMLLSQLGIARNIVNTAFALIVGAIAVAFAISFGIGGRDFAASVLKDAKDKIDEEKAAAKAAKEAAEKEAAEADKDDAKEGKEKTKEGPAVVTFAKGVVESADDALQNKE